MHCAKRKKRATQCTMRTMMIHTTVRKRLDVKSKTTEKRNEREKNHEEKLIIFFNSIQWNFSVNHFVCVFVYAVRLIRNQHSNSPMTLIYLSGNEKKWACHQNSQINVGNFKLLVNWQIGGVEMKQIIHQLILIGFSPFSHPTQPSSEYCDVCVMHCLQFFTLDR